MKKIFVGYIVRDPKGYDQDKILIAVSEDRERILTKLKVELQLLLDKNDWEETYEIEIVETPLI